MVILENLFMARSATPWYREDRQSWYVTIRGKRHNLGPNKKAAFKRFHELMLEPVYAPPPPTNKLSIATAFDKFRTRSVNDCSDFIHP